MVGKVHFFTWLIVMKVCLYNNSLLSIFVLCKFLFYLIIEIYLSGTFRMNCITMSHLGLPCGHGQLVRMKGDERTGEPAKAI